MLELRCLAPG